MDTAHAKMYKINVSEYIPVFLIVFEKVSHLSNHDFNIIKILSIHIYQDNDCLESSLPSEIIQRILQMAWKTPIHVLIFCMDLQNILFIHDFTNKKINTLSVSSLVNMIMAKLWGGHAMKTLVSIQHQGKASLLPKFSNCNTRMTWGLVTAGPLIWIKLLI